MASQLSPHIQVSPTHTHLHAYRQTCTCTLLASFFLPSHLSLKNMYSYMYNLHIHVHIIYIHVLMRDERKGRKKQARSNKQQLRQSNTAHPLFLRKMSGTQTHNTLHSRQSALPLSYQGSSAGWAQISHLIVHYYQLNMKEKAGVMKPPKTHVHCNYTIRAAN